AKPKEAIPDGGRSRPRENLVHRVHAKGEKALVFPPSLTPSDRDPAGETSSARHQILSLALAQDNRGRASAVRTRAPVKSRARSRPASTQSKSSCERHYADPLPHEARSRHTRA